MAAEPKPDMANSSMFQSATKGDIRVALLAAGLGKRMDPLTANHLPKPMFPLGGSVPIIERWIRQSLKSGITDISLNLCVLQETIESYFKDGARFGARITYVEEETPSGTFGGVCKQALGNRAKPTIANETMPSIGEFKGSTLIVPSGDIVSGFDADMFAVMYDIHKQKGAALTMVLSPIPWDKRGEFGTAVLQSPEKLPGKISQSGQIDAFREKDPHSPSNLNNASIYMIEMDLIKALDPLRTEASPRVAEPFYDFGKHVFPAMLGKLEYVRLPQDYLLWGIRYDGLWFDVGRKRDYIEVNKAFLDGDFELEIPYPKTSWGYLGAGVDIDFSKVTLIPPVIIGHNCKIGPGTVLGPYAVIGDDWTIEAQVTIKNSILWPRYAFFTADGTEISVKEREKIDCHRIYRGIILDGCIIVGGAIRESLSQVTADVLQDGSMRVLPIDFVPEGPRA